MALIEFLNYILSLIKTCKIPDHGNYLHVTLKSRTQLKLPLGGGDMATFLSNLIESFSSSRSRILLTKLCLWFISSFSCEKVSNHKRTLYDVMYTLPDPDPPSYWKLYWNNSFSSWVCSKIVPSFISGFPPLKLLTGTRP